MLSPCYHSAEGRWLPVPHISWTLRPEQSRCGPPAAAGGFAGTVAGTDSEGGRRGRPVRPDV